MNTYNLDQLIKRTGTSSIKWDETNKFFGCKDVLPMWIADMDFTAPQVVNDALIEKIKHGIYGYTSVPSSNSEAVQAWIKRRHKWDVLPEWFTYISGVVPALSVAIQALTQPNDKVMIFSPVYYPFFDMINWNDRRLVTSPLHFENGRYHMDWANFESQIDEDVKLLLLCNPHNPGGTVWTKEELKKLGDICVKHNIKVVSDEIHGDHVLTGHNYTPYASISDTFAQMSITCMAPTKTFNIAGLQAAVMLIPNKEIREKINLFQMKQGHFTLNAFAIVAMEAAYRFGEPWLDQVLSYIEVNMDTAIAFIQEELPALCVSKPEGSYLLWIDCRHLGISDNELKELLLKKGKLALDFGKKFGPEGDGFVRMNVACPRETLIEGLKRLKIAFS
ncbi:MalY/PatB family protein [Sutcliffiella halmapala]|uniref:MalY/PatB family protein n=1 Tax=Sutcliffiella halmapala TaxID=79882 RepID=UPI0009957CAA|nr:MalY/PatB family protein [Sutcliffiella halmapala]